MLPSDIVSQDKHESLHTAVVVFSLLAITLSVNLQVPLYKTYADIAGYGGGLIAVTFAAYVAGLIPVLTLLGGISDVVGRKKIILVSLAITVLAHTLMIVAPSLEMLLFIRILLGVAVGLSVAACTAYIAESNLGSAHVASLISLVIAAGLGSGSLLTSFALMAKFSTVPISYYTVWFAALAGFVAVIFLPEKITDKKVKYISAPCITEISFKYCMAIFLAWSLTGIIIATIPGELEKLGYMGWSGFLVFLSICTGALVQPWIRELSYKVSVLAGLILFLMSFLILLAGITSESLVLLLTAAACSGASSFGLVYLGGMKLVVKSSGLEKARAVSGFSLFAYLGLGLPCIFAGFLSSVIGLFQAIVLVGAVLLITSLLVVAVVEFSFKKV